MIALIGEQAASSRVLYGIGVASAVVAVLAMARVRREYPRELVLALREGRPNVFGGGPLGEEPSDLGRGDAAAVSVAMDGLSDADPRVRRLAAYVLGELRAAEATSALVRALHENDTGVRAAALRSLGRAGQATTWPEVCKRTPDPLPEVRLAALDALGSLNVSAGEAARTVDPLLRDSDPPVRARAAAFLLHLGPDPNAEAALVEMAAATDPDVRAAAFRAVAGSRSPNAFGIALSGLGDRAPAVRLEAAQALAAIDPSRALDPLLGAMTDEHARVRAAVVTTFREGGP